MKTTDELSVPEMQLICAAVGRLPIPIASREHQVAVGLVTKLQGRIRKIADDRAREFTRKKS